MTLAEAITKAQKLLALSESSNPHEAATALKMAQKILTQYQISQDMLDDGTNETEEDIVNERDEPLDIDSKFNLENWRGRLAGIIAKVNSCTVYTRTTFDRTQQAERKGIYIIGRPSDASKVRYLYKYFYNEIQRLAKRDSKGNGKVWLNNYRHGVVDTVTEKLLESVEEVKHELLADGRKSGDLARVEKAIARMDNRLATVENWIKDNIKLKSSGSYRMNSDRDAREKGREAGREINQTKARGALNA